MVVGVAAWACMAAGAGLQAEMPERAQVLALAIFLHLQATLLPVLLSILPSTWDEKVTSNLSGKKI
jgi:hypothetical protein